MHAHFRQGLRGLALLLAASVVAPAADAQTPFDDCGYLVSGVTCSILLDDPFDTKTYLLDNTGGFQVGDYVHVIGSYDPCGTFCMQNTYCMTVLQITLCSPPVPGTPFCLGDGSDGVLCPCGNVTPTGSGEGCANSTTLGAKLVASGDPSVSADTLVLTVEQAVPSEFGIYVQNIATAAPTPFYDGALCLATDSHLVRHYSPPAIQPTVTDALGVGTNAQALTLGDFLGDTAPGQTVHYQYWGRDSTGPCGTGAHFSSGLSIPWTL